MQSLESAPMSWQNGETEAEPRVYLPSGDGEAPPAYEAYADPAAAHGWQDAYDGAGAYDGPGARAADGDGPGADGEGAVARAGAGRRAPSRR
ncbi:hypothetical protein OK006_6922, partial [Actinobacteria bacterium OK006]